MSKTTSSLAAGPPASQDDPRLAPILAHLRQYWDTADVGTMREVLIAAGHPEPLVDEAIGRLGVVPGPRPRPTWPMAALFVALDILLLLAAATLASPALGETSYRLQYYLAAGLLYLAQLVAGLRLRGGPRDALGRALLRGLAIAAGLVAVAALLFVSFALLIYRAWSS